MATAVRSYRLFTCWDLFTFFSSFDFHFSFFVVRFSEVECHAIAYYSIQDARWALHFSTYLGGCQAGIMAWVSPWSVSGHLGCGLRWFGGVEYAVWYTGKEHCCAFVHFDAKDHNTGGPLYVISWMKVTRKHPHG